MKTNIEKNFPVIVATMANAIYQGPPGPEADLTNYYTKSEVDGLIPDTSGFALKTEIPSVPTNVSSFTNDAEYTNKTYVDNAIAQAVTGGQVDLSNYYTKSETDAAIEAAAPDLSGYALKSEIPDTTGLASEQYVQNQIAAIPETDLSDYATISYVNTEIAKVVTSSEVDLSNYYTKNETNAAIQAAKPDLSGYALKSEIPDTTGLATEQYVNDAVANIDIPEVDLTNYYTKSEVDAKIPNTSGFLTEVPAEYITETELTAKGYQTEEQVNTLINTALGVIENGTY